MRRLRLGEEQPLVRGHERTVAVVLELTSLPPSSIPPHPQRGRRAVLPDASNIPPWPSVTGLHLGEPTDPICS